MLANRTMPRHAATSCESQAGGRSRSPEACVTSTSRVGLKAPEALGVLADEAEDAAPVPEGPPCEETLVCHGLVMVDRHGLRDVPPLPAGLAGAVGEVDLLAVEVVALVEAAELLEQLAAEEEEGAEQPVGLDRLGRVLVEEVVAALALLRLQHAPERGPADDRSAHGREA